MGIRLRRILSSISIYTGITADLIAIIPVVYTIFAAIKLVPTIDFTEEGLRLLTRTDLGIQELSLILLFYAFVAIFYAITQRIELIRYENYNYPTLRLRSYERKSVAFLAQLSISLPLALLIPLVALLIVYGYFPISHGFAIETLLFFMVMFLYFRWGKHDIRVGFQYGTINRQDFWVGFKGIGYWFLVSLPLIWFWLHLDVRFDPLADAVFAFSYFWIGIGASLLWVRLIAKYYARISQVDVSVNSENINLLSYVFLSIIFIGLLTLTFEGLAYLQTN